MEATATATLAATALTTDSTTATTIAGASLLLQMAILVYRIPMGSCGKKRKF